MATKKHSLKKNTKTVHKTKHRKATKAFSKRRLTIIAVGVIAAAAFAFNLTYQQLKDTFAATTPVSVMATGETAPVPNTGDAADDPAIWVNPENASLSAVIGTDKKGGLAVYDLNGAQIQYAKDGLMNNVDLKSGFILNGQSVVLVTATNRSNNTIAIYTLNPATRTLTNVANRLIKPSITAYGICMYHSPVSNKYYSYITGKVGDVDQWELFDAGNGKVDAVKTRTFKVATSETEGCVADDELAKLYVSDEDHALWKYDAEPPAATEPTNTAPPRVAVDVVGSAGHLSADVEGLSISYNSDGTGYLFASSQGNSTFAVYRREGNNAYVKSFKIVTGNGIDNTSSTDGIDVVTANLGTKFPYGLFVAQDNTNDVGNQNFKYVPLQNILGLPVTPVISSTPGATVVPSTVPDATVTPEPSSIQNTPTPTPEITVVPSPTPVAGGGVTSLLPTADANVQADTPTTNKGTSTSLNVNGGNNPARITYFKFDLRNLPNLPVVNAKLQLLVTNVSANVQSVKNVPDNSWTETGITYNNRPLPDSTITTSTSPTASTISIDLTSYVESHRGQIVTILIDQTGSDGTTYNSKEASSGKPTLQVTQ